MECIKYINDLEIEIKMLDEIYEENKNDVLLEKIQRKKRILENCKNNISKLSIDKICYRIYLYILNGYSVSKAIDKVAEENLYNDTKPSTPNHIWKYYYPKLKKVLENPVK